MNIIFYKDIDSSRWNDLISRIDTVSYYHSWSWLDFSSKFSNIKEHASFIVLDGDNPIAVCSLAVTYNAINDMHELSFPGAPLGIPAVIRDNSRLRRDTLDYIFNIYDSYVKNYGAKIIKMLYHPLDSVFCQSKSLGFAYSFELLRYGMQYCVNNTAIVDLSLSEEMLLQNMSKYHRRHIMRSKKRGIYVKVFNRNNNVDELKRYFDFCQGVHFSAAGRMTRPQETWDSMYRGALKGDASLFVGFIDNIPLSYLYCGEFSSMAFGWSQANVKEYEGKYCPRHILEWQAILYYKDNGFNFYEIGEVFYKPQIFRSSTEKEISIGLFKERYGGFLLPKTTWFGYYDKELKKNDLSKCIKDYLEAPDSNAFNLDKAFK